MYRVYVAGKYNDSNVIDVLDNIRIGIEVGCNLLERGYAPFVPFLDFQFGLVRRFEIEEYKRYSMAWVDVCDAVFMLRSGERSEGAKAEAEHAHMLGIPVFTTMTALDSWRAMKEAIGESNKT